MPLFKWKLNFFLTVLERFICLLLHVVSNQTLIALLYLPLAYSRRESMRFLTILSMYLTRWVGLCGVYPCLLYHFFLATMNKALLERYTEWGIMLCCPLSCPSEGWESETSCLFSALQALTYEVMMDPLGCR